MVFKLYNFDKTGVRINTRCFQSGFFYLVKELVIELIAMR